jgi:hypothetical protein
MPGEDTVKFCVQISGDLAGQRSSPDGLSEKKHDHNMFEENHYLDKICDNYTGLYKNYGNNSTNK